VLSAESLPVIYPRPPTQKLHLGTWVPVMCIVLHRQVGEYCNPRLDIIETKFRPRNSQPLAVQSQWQNWWTEVATVLCGV